MLAKQTLKRLQTIVSSWFVDLETKPEFIKSQQFFNNLLKERKHILGEHCVIAIEHLIADLISKDQFLFNYNFINKCTLGFKGDSIVESSFSATKRGHTVVSTRRRIDRSAMNMVNHVAERSRRENSKKCHDQYREVCWTRSGVKDILTTYALGIFCKNFDRRGEYYVEKNNEKSWYVCHEKTFGEPTTVLYHPRFTRVRKVSLDGRGFLNCSCGRTNNYLLPCSHICAVVGEDHLFTPESFHIRWHKHYSYLHGNDFGRVLAPKTIKVMEDFLTETRQGYYGNDGLYRGINMNSSLFMSTYSNFNATKDEEKKHFMHNVFEKSLNHTTLHGEVTFQNFRRIVGASSPDMFKSHDSPLMFSLFSQEEFCDKNAYTEDMRLSQMKNDDASAYHQTFESYERALTTISTDEEVKKLNKVLNSFSNDNIERKKRVSRDNGECVLFGENLTPTTHVQKRRKALYEIVRKINF